MRSHKTKPSVGLFVIIKDHVSLPSATAEPPNYSLPVSKSHSAAETMAATQRNVGEQTDSRQGRKRLPRPFDGFTKVKLKLHVQTHHFNHLLHLLPTNLNPVRLLPIIVAPPLHILRLSWKTEDGVRMCGKIHRGGGGGGGPLESVSISQALMSSSVLTLTRRPVA